jgi:hypothetical protein
VVSGVSVAAYWAMMFVGRAVLGPVAQSVGAASVLSGAVAGVAAGAALMAAPGPAFVAVVGPHGRGPGRRADLPPAHPHHLHLPRGWLWADRIIAVYARLRLIPTT